jgi:hypothetical protein
MSYSFATAALNPRTHYANGTNACVMKDLQEAFEYMVDTDTCVTALQEADHFRQKHGTFSTELVQKMRMTKIPLRVCFKIYRYTLDYLTMKVPHFGVSCTLQHNGELCLAETHLSSRGVH